MSSGITSEVFNIYRQRPKAAVLMSGLGSNAEALLRDEEFRDLYNVNVIVTDNPASNARIIADKHNLKLIENISHGFSSSAERVKYFSTLSTKFDSQGVCATIYAGFMKIASTDFCESFPGVNVHPADLSIKGTDRVAKYRGMKALSLMRADVGYVSSTVHVVDNPVDSGSAIAISEPVWDIDPSASDYEVHDMLKEHERVIYPRTLILLGRGSLLPSKIPYDHTEIEELYYAY
jgi:folate-dependent phosphoribosylglycinamide formyltransferase PurN